MKYPPIQRIMPDMPIERTVAGAKSFKIGYVTGRRHAMLDLLDYCRDNKDKSLTVIIEMLAEAE